MDFRHGITEELFPEHLKLSTIENDVAVGTLGTSEKLQRVLQSNVS